jgi:hypothetical protein
MITRAHPPLPRCRRPSRVPVAVIAVLACASVPANAEELFDGSTFAGWNGDTSAVWRIEAGAIVAGDPDRPAPRNEFLATNRSFRNFELRLEYKLDCGMKCNAGVQIRSERIPNHHEMIGYQADIGPGWDGCLYDESRRRRLLAKADPDVVARALAASRDGWHDYVIRCEGPRVRLSLNGVETVDYEEPDPAIPHQGAIALQIHASMTGAIRYRNIRITELP